MDISLSTVKFHSADAVVAAQRTEKGLAYDSYVDGIRKLRSSAKSEHKAMAMAMAKDLVDALCKGVSASSVHANQYLSNMSIQYANDEYIGERLMPATDVDKRSDSYASYSKRDRLAYPDDALSEKAEPNELSETRGSANYSVKDYGYKNWVSADTVSNEDAIFDEMMDLVEAINEGIAFRREKRIATLVTTAGSYSGNTVTLAGSDQWNSAGGGDPAGVFQTAKANLWRGRNGQTQDIGFCSLDIFNVLSRNQRILDLLKYNRAGLATKAEIASILGLDDLLVGEARQDTANIGQTASYGRIWGNYAGVLRVAKRPTKRSVCFGTTFRLKGDPITTEWFDPRSGKSGGHHAKVAVSEDHKIVAADAGYLIVSPIA